MYVGELLLQKTLYSQQRTVCTRELQALFSTPLLELVEQTMQMIPTQRYADVH